MADRPGTVMATFDREPAVPLIAILAAVAGGALMIGWPATAAGWAAAPVEHALTAVVGTLGRVATGLLPEPTSPGAALAHDAVLVAVPGLAAVAFAAAAKATQTLRRVVMALMLVCSLGAWWLLDGWQATVAMAAVALVAAVVSFGTRWAVTVPLALLTGALAVRTALALLAGTSPGDPTLDLAAVGLVDGPVAVAAAEVVRWVLATVGFAVAVGIWRRA